MARKILRSLLLGLSRRPRLGEAMERVPAARRFVRRFVAGTRHDLHRRLPASGLALRVLVPFGEDWYGYFMRRLAERPANLAFFLRHLLRPGGAPSLTGRRVTTMLGEQDE